LMQKVPAEVDEPQLLEKIKALDKVTALHDIHLWTLDGERHIITLHVVTSSNITVYELSAVKHSIRDICKQFGVYHATIELETDEETCEFEGGCC
jgi:cobalt-zinc-cadmium efflux system protein